MKRFNVSVKRLGIVVTSLTLVMLFLVTVVLPISAPTQEASSPSVSIFKFDFGTPTSPVESGYTRVTASTGYSGILGYGWVSTGALVNRDRGAPDALRRDLVMSSSDGAFNVDLANGAYNMSVIIGDNNWNRDNIDVYAEGVLKADDVTASAGSFEIRAFSITVSDGQLNLVFSDDGGSNSAWVVNAIWIGGEATPSTVDISGWLHTTESGRYVNIDVSSAWVELASIETRGYRQLAFSLRPYNSACELLLQWRISPTGAPTGYVLHNEPSFTVSGGGEVFRTYDVVGHEIIIYVRYTGIPERFPISAYCYYHLTT